MSEGIAVGRSWRTNSYGASLRLRMEMFASRCWILTFIGFQCILRANNLMCK